ncbi:MAG: DUF4115 domain-containing protein [Chloroflexi bacterium]|nr:DUF4115 domain-containing protein [Chloroflexota bacterium]
MDTARATDGQPPSNAAFRMIGERLRAAREARGWSLLHVAHQTRIKPVYLEALEKGDWDALPSLAQARGFLRLYASFLGLDPGELLHLLDRAPATLAEGAESASATEREAAVPPLPEDDPAYPHWRAVGETLRKQREALGLSLEAAARLSHVKEHYLRALEAGRMDLLPSPVQGRGMLSHYARALHLDPEPLLLKFAAGLQARHQAQQAARAQNPTRAWVWRARSARWFRTWAGMGVLAAMGLFFLWSTWQVARAYIQQSMTPTLPPLRVPVWTLPRPTPAVTPSPTVRLTLIVPVDLTPVAGATEVGAATEADQPPPPEASATALTSTLTPNPGAGLTPEAGTGIRVVVLVRHRTWLRALADGQEIYRGRPLPGSRFTFRAEERLEIQSGDASALHLIFGQQDLGVLGRWGEPLVLIFTLQGMITPTPMASPTPTPSATPTPTPTGPTPTPGGPTLTPTLTPTPLLRPRP